LFVAPGDYLFTSIKQLNYWVARFLLYRLLSLPGQINCLFVKYALQLKAPAKAATTVEANKTLL